MRTIWIAVAIGLLACSVAYALTPADLTPQEAAVYKTLANDQQAEKSYLVSRDFLRSARAVENKTLPALQMPRQPADYDAKYLSADEQKTVEHAIIMYIAALLNKH